MSWSLSFAAAGPTTAPPVDHHRVLVFPGRSHERLNTGCAFPVWAVRFGPFALAVQPHSPVFFRCAIRLWCFAGAGGATARRWSRSVFFCAACLRPSVAVPLVRVVVVIPFWIRAVIVGGPARWGNYFQPKNVQPKIFKYFQKFSNIFNQKIPNMFNQKFFFKYDTKNFFLNMAPKIFFNMTPNFF